MVLVRLQMFPQNWGAKVQTGGWFLDNYIGARAALTHNVSGKPIVLEETGCQAAWGDRDEVRISMNL